MRNSITHVVWLFTAVLAAEVGVVAVTVRVAVLEPAERFSSSATLHNGDGRLILPSSRVPVPKFKQRYGSVPTTSHHFMNSSVPNSFDSVPIQASSGLDGCQYREERAHVIGRSNVAYRPGLFSLGPTPSSQWYVATKLPPGYLTTGTFKSWKASITSLRKPFSSERGLPGSYMPP